jgi:hypothetical protein
MTLLFIGPDEQDALKAAVELARKKPLTIDQVMQRAKSIDQSTDVVTLAERKTAPAESRHAQQVELPVGYRVAISFEEQPAGMCLHLSMSSGAPSKVPHPDAVNMVLQAIGVDAKDCVLRAWIEEFLIDGKPGGNAANVVVLMDPVGHA